MLSLGSTTTPSVPRDTVTAWNGMRGKQGGDPTKLAKGLVRRQAKDTTLRCGPRPRRRGPGG